MAAPHKYVGVFFLLVLGSFFVGMLVSSVILSVRAIKKESYTDAYFKDVPTFPQHPGVTDAEYWKAKAAAKNNLY